MSGDLLVVIGYNSKWVAVVNSDVIIGAIGVMVFGREPSFFVQCSRVIERPAVSTFAIKQKIVVVIEYTIRFSHKCNGKSD